MPYSFLGLQRVTLSDESKVLLDHVKFNSALRQTASMTSVLRRACTRAVEFSESHSATVKRIVVPPPFQTKNEPPPAQVPNGSSDEFLQSCPPATSVHDGTSEAFKDHAAAEVDARSRLRLEGVS